MLQSSKQSPQPQSKSKSTILFCGDPHGQFGHIIEAVHNTSPAAVILLGDVQAQRPLDVELAEILSLTEIWFIHGNHDTDSDLDYDNLFNSKLAHRNLSGRVVEIAGMRIAGLGGVFRGQVWMPPAEPNFATAKDHIARGGKGNRWRGGLSRKHRSTIFLDEVAALSKQRADILVTHEAPSANEFGFAAIDDLARSLRVKASFHGHQHVKRDYAEKRAELGFTAFGVGLRGVLDQDGQDVVIGS